MENKMNKINWEKIFVYTVILAFTTGGIGFFYEFIGEFAKAVQHVDVQPWLTICQALSILFFTLALFVKLKHGQPSLAFKYAVVVVIIILPILLLENVLLLGNSVENWFTNTARIFILAAFVTVLSAGLKKILNRTSP
jgi:hypothetical protein